MIILSIIYWIIALLFLKGAKRKEENRWAVALAFSAGLAGFGRDLEEVFIPYLINNFTVPPEVAEVGRFIHIFTHFPNLFFNPYFFLMLSLSFSRRLNVKKRLILLIPPLITQLIISLLGEQRELKQREIF